MMGLIKHLVVFVAFGVSGCVIQERKDVMSNGEEQRQRVFAQILSENRARLDANAAALQTVGRTPCGGGYALELFAPRAIRFTAARRQSTAAREDALFWVLRVPDRPEVAEVSITVSNAWDKPDWYAEIRRDNRWRLVRKPASNGTAHASLVDAPTTLRLSDAQRTSFCRFRWPAR